ncbi:tyrosine-protein kinase Fer-like isoform X2 [Folsomia candida]|uniref:tyrosine-protein kinase Fer-like isoform X2 n=1 Tax=Folsomia candida TaxID=158441 RepID=UPI001604C4FC|nr:tyrosine-protein kinase Fer-like isoform X2 [Folsomia candida]
MDSPDQCTGGSTLWRDSPSTWTRGNKTTWEEDVAIKLLKDPLLIDKAEAEVLRMSRLDHPNIVKCFGISFPNETPWIVMECMTGGDLLSYICNYAGGMPVDTMTQLAYGIALGMQYLHHTADQYHGDLAARNCLIGPNNTIKVGDFGKFDNDYEDSYFDWNHGQVCAKFLIYFSLVTIFTSL